MNNIQIGNAPCSWGALEFEGLPERQIGYAQMLDELVETGYTGTELGDWGYMPTDPAALSGELRRRNLAMLGAFVPVALKDAAAHEQGQALVLRAARLIAAAAAEHQPFLVLADDNGADPVRTRNAGRVTAQMGLSAAAWRTFAAGVNQIARAVADETGLRTVFHHHGAGFVETPDEIAQLLELTDPALVGLVFDTGHYTLGAGEDGPGLVDGLNRFGDRIWHIHFKDCHPEIVRRARDEGWDYFAAIRAGVFCELGQGSVDFPAAVGWLRARGYRGWAVVEQDVLPGMGTPKQSARRNREYLRSIGV